MRSHFASSHQIVCVFAHITSSSRHLDGNSATDKAAQNEHMSRTQQRLQIQPRRLECSTPRARARASARESRVSRLRGSTTTLQVRHSTVFGNRRCSTHTWSARTRRQEVQCSHQTRRADRKRHSQWHGSHEPGRTI